MKVLLTHELFPPECTKMGEKIAYEMAKRLIERGVELRVLTTGNSSIKDFDGIETVRMPINRYLMNLTAPWIYKHAKDFDIIQTSNYNACYPSFLAAKWVNKPVVCLVHGAYGRRWLKMRGPLFGRLSMVVEKFQLNHEYDKFIFLSDYARDSAVQIGVNKRLTEVIRPGIDFEKYKVGKKERFVLFVGRLEKQKGLDYLIEAAKRLPEVKFIIVGKGKEAKGLKERVGDNVEFLGFVSDKKLVDLYSRALVLCLPSIAETFGFVQVEAMASGCAIVSTTRLDYEGIYVEPGNVGDLAKAISQLVNEPKKAMDMGRRNRIKAKKYKWSSFINRVMNIYESLVRK